MEVLTVDALELSAEQYTYEVDGWGVGELVVEDDVLLAHALPRRRRAPATDPAGGVVRPNSPVVPSTTPKRETLSHGVTLAGDRGRVYADFVSTFVERVRRQLNGTLTAYDDVPLDLSWCTPFQAELAAALLAVRWGEIVSYGELAALAGRPGAARAAGSFCAQNRFALVMPCHRVVGATGIGGYGDSGLSLKRRLLALENVEL